MLGIAGGTPMTDLTLAAADTIIKAGLAHARQKNMKPLGIVVLDARAAVKAYAAEDGTSLKRYEIAHGKAYGALAFGLGSRTLGKMAVERPHFVAAATHAVGALVPVAGGVLIKNAAGAVVGAVGVSGDTSDNDEAAALAGIAAAKLVGDGGAG
jgi:uncharacterized protein GlcG (DUF336 family)